ARRRWLCRGDGAEGIAGGVGCPGAPAIRGRLAKRSKLDPPAYDGTRMAAPAFQRTRKTGHHRNRRGIRGPSADAIGMRPTKANWVSNDSPLEGHGFEPVWGFFCQVVFLVYWRVFFLSVQTDL